MRIQVLFSGRICGFGIRGMLILCWKGRIIWWKGIKLVTVRLYILHGGKILFRNSSTVN
jgi:hypothetical protein